MYRFLVLYVGSDGLQYFAEGLIHVDASVYARGFWPEDGKYYSDLHALKRALRDNEQIVSWHIQMVDEVEVRVNGI